MSIRIDILSAIPKLLASPLSESILKIAQEKKLAEIVVHDLRDLHTTNIIRSTSRRTAEGPA